MYLSKKDIGNLNRVKRLNIINSVTGIKPGNLIGTKSLKGETNLAIFSSLIHLGSNPALLGFIVRPANKIRRDTYQNILETGYYTINHITNKITKKAHYSSIKFSSDISEFDKLNLTEEYLNGFEVPFLKESTVKIGMKFQEEIDIKSNGTKLIIGEIIHLNIPEKALSSEGYLNLEQLDTIGIGGLNSYYQLTLKEQYPYARIDEIPNFDESKSQ